MQQQIEFNRSAIHPIQCLNEGWELLKGGNYPKFLIVLTFAFFAILLSFCTPFMLFMPPVVCGMYLCAFAMMERQPFNTAMLSKGWSFFGQSFLASLVLTVPIILMLVVTNIGLAVTGAQMDRLDASKNPNPDEVFWYELAFFGLFFGIFPLIILTSTIIGIFTAFVFPLIVDCKLSAIEALKLSFRAVMGNFIGVIGLTLLGHLIIYAGLMLFGIGALLVSPVIIMAWAVAYRRVFSSQVTPPDSQFATPVLGSSPVSSSQAGLFLTMSSFVIVVLGIAGFGVIGYFSYHALIEDAENEPEQRKASPTPSLTPSQTPYQKPTLDIPKTPPKTLPKQISGGILNGKAIELSKPVHPAAARAAKASGSVNVEVLVDEQGNVISAKAVSGHPLLHAAAVQAAQNAKFKPTLLSGQAVKVSGKLVFNFTLE